MPIVPSIVYGCHSGAIHGLGRELIFLPQVRRMVVRLLLYDLGGHVERRALDRRQEVRVEVHDSGETKVAQLHAPVGAEEDVLRLYIPAKIERCSKSRHLRQLNLSQFLLVFN